MIVPPDRLWFVIQRFNPYYIIIDRSWYVFFSAIDYLFIISYLCLVEQLKNNLDINSLLFCRRRICQIRNVVEPGISIYNFSMSELPVDVLIPVFSVSGALFCVITSRTTNCGCLFIPRNILPRYSPMVPINNMMSPEKKQMAHIMEGHPSAIAGFTSLRITIASAPRILNIEKKYPQ